MNRLAQHTLTGIMLTLTGLMISGTAMAIDCPVNVNAMNLDVATQTIEASGPGFNAIYNGENAVIMPYLALHPLQPNLIVTYTVDSATCIAGGNIQAMSL